MQTNLTDVWPLDLFPDMNLNSILQASFTQAQCTQPASLTRFCFCARLSMKNFEALDPTAVKLFYFGR
jgi:hypothetical protein